MPCAFMYDQHCLVAWNIVSKFHRDYSDKVGYYTRLLVMPKRHCVSIGKYELLAKC
jgi:hypothetical protein